MTNPRFFKRYLSRVSKIDKNGNYSNFMNMV